MKKRSKVLLLAIFLMISIIVSACSAQKSDLAKNESAPSPGGNSSSGSYTSEDAKETDKGSVSNNTSFNQTNINVNEKIIFRVTLGVETMEFDNLIDIINSQINLLGGYVENSSIRGNSFYRESLRYGNIVARIPKDRLNEFKSTVSESANVVSDEISSENITLRYIDVESHKKALEIEQERLLALLEKEDTLEDIIALESRLSTIRYELQSYESQLRTYDNLVEYSTITLNIQEVKRVTPVEEADNTFFGRIQNGLSDTMYNLSEGLKNSAVWLIINLPYLLIWAIIILGIILILKKVLRNNRKSNDVVVKSINDIKTVTKTDNDTNNEHK